MGDPNKLATVQAGRACAAGVVVLAHASTLSGFGGSVFKAGHAGVDFFFVLSGFIITLVHAKDVGRPGEFLGYLRKRVRRIYPPYWIASLIAVALAAAGMANSVSGGLARFELADSLRAIFLFPSYSGPFLGVGWTLEHEMLFYAVFGVLILHRAAGLILLGSWLGWSLLTAIIFPLPAFPWALSNLWIDFLGSSYHLQFGAGMLVAFFLARRALRFPMAWLAAGLTMLLATATAEGHGSLDGLGQLARLTYGLGSAMVLAGLVQGERNGQLHAPARLVFLGEASYSIYLVHVPFMMLASTLWKPSLGVISFTILAAVGVLAGCLLHLSVERPLLRRPAFTSVLLGYPPQS
jgi:peptidoglycan/LPS O-acetylase OafA/YrhL